MKVIRNYPPYALETVPVRAIPDSTSRRLVPYSSTWYYTTIIMRVLILLFGGGIWGLIVVNDGRSPVVWFPVIIADIVYQAVELMVLTARSTEKRGTHPVAHLIADLAFWMAYFVMAILYAIAVFPDWDNESGQLRQAHMLLRIFIDVFLFVLWLLHFVIFVRDCIEVHQRRQPHPPGVMYYVPGQGGAPFVLNNDFHMSEASLSTLDASELSKHL
ncbi:hypothetical protein VP1G_07500 [Cytospora mali]|uniref:Uncharacterized protein n=1 Tax=Cytospora mali TaxID=578113 RepID=A0A194V8U4_CYTMA|nr:hypothetical protein VP1G_07500 [Valsa mali var. pyri (nom. inval.)]